MTRTRGSTLAVSMLTGCKHSDVFELYRPGAFAPASAEDGSKHQSTFGDDKLKGELALELEERLQLVPGSDSSCAASVCSENSQSSRSPSPPPRELEDPLSPVLDRFSTRFSHAGGPSPYSQKVVTLPELGFDVADGEAIQNCSILVPEGATLLIDVDVTLRNVTVRSRSRSGGAEGLELVNPADSHGSAPSLVVRASVELDAVVIDCAATGGVLVDGRACLRMQYCRVVCYEAPHGLVVREAMLEAYRCVVDYRGSAGLEVTCGRVLISDCMLLGTGDGQTRALSARRGANVRLVGCVLSKTACGVSVASAATVDLRNCNLDGHSDHGLLVTGSQSSVALTGCTIASSRRGVSGSDGAQVRISESSFTNVLSAVRVSGTGSDLLMQNVSVVRVGADAVVVEGGAVGRLRSASFVNGAAAAVVVRHPRSKMDMIDCEVRRFVVGLKAAVHAKARASRCEFCSMGRAGCIVVDKQTTLHLQQSVVAGGGVLGVFAYKSADLHLVDCLIAKNVSSGVEVQGKGTQCEIKDCSIVDNGKVGVYVHSSASAVVHSSQIKSECAVLCGGQRKVNIGGGTVLLHEDVAVEGMRIKRFFGRVFDLTRADLTASSHDSD